MTVTALHAERPRLATGNAALLAISHGTTSPTGRKAVAALVNAVAGRLHGTAVRGGFVDVQQPDVAATIESVMDQRAAIVVPLLLSAGYHVHVDLVGELAAVPGLPTMLAAALGPDDRLVDILVARLLEAGLRDRDVVVMAAAGSSDAQAVRDCHEMAERLSRALGRRVRLGFISAAHPRLPAVVEAAISEVGAERVLVASYLLAPGYFTDLAHACAPGRVTRPLLTDDTPPPAALVDLVLDRYHRATLSLPFT